MIPFLGFSFLCEEQEFLAADAGLRTTPHPPRWPQTVACVMLSLDNSPWDHPFYHFVLLPSFVTRSLYTPFSRLDVSSLW